jgi:hypothetical protein
MGGVLAVLLEVLARTNVEELTERFLDLYNSIVETLNPGDQEVAKEALADRRADNDEGHARLQAKLAAAQST